MRAIYTGVPRVGALGRYTLRDNTPCSPRNYIHRNLLRLSKAGGAVRKVTGDNNSSDNVYNVVRSMAII